jgi:hypothetical protein
LHAQANIYIYIYRGADKSLARQGRKQATAIEDFDVHISYLLSQLEEYTSIYIYICIYTLTRLASKEIFSPSTKTHREVGQVKELTAPCYVC